MFAFDGKLELPRLHSQAGAWERAVLELDPAEPYFFIAFAKALAIKLLIGAGAAACFWLCLH